MIIIIIIIIIIIMIIIIIIEEEKQTNNNNNTCNNSLNIPNVQLRNVISSEVYNKKNDSSVKRHNYHSYFK